MGVEPKIGVVFTPTNHPILIGFSIINHPFWGFSPYFWFNTHIYIYHISVCFLSSHIYKHSFSSDNPHHPKTKHRPPVLDRHVLATKISPQQWRWISRMEDTTVRPILHLGGGFKDFFIFTRIWGRFPFWLIFSNGLKPPPRLHMQHTMLFYV